MMGTVDTVNFIGGLGILMYCKVKKERTGNFLIFLGRRKGKSIFGEGDFKASSE